MKLSDIDFRYSANVEYDEYRPCQEGSDCCVNDYCRCGELTNARVTEPPDIIHHILKKLSDWDKYVIERIYNSAHPWDEASFDVQVVGGYYGEEIGSVTLENGKVLDKHLEDCLSLSNSDKIRYLLNLEYGYVLPRLISQEFEIKTINKKLINFGNNGHYKRLDKKIVERYKNYTLPRGVVVQNGSNYDVIDGYHRISAGTNKITVFSCKGD